jgi:hypothetical protein
MKRAVARGNSALDWLSSSGYRFCRFARRGLLRFATLATAGFGGEPALARRSEIGNPPPANVMIDTKADPAPLRRRAPLCPARQNHFPAPRFMHNFATSRVA